MERSTPTIPENFAVQREPVKHILFHSFYVDSSVQLPPCSPAYLKVLTVASYTLSSLSSLPLTHLSLSLYLSLYLCIFVSASIFMVYGIQNLSAHPHPLASTRNWPRTFARLIFTRSVRVGAAELAEWNLILRGGSIKRKIRGGILADSLEAEPRRRAVGAGGDEGRPNQAKIQFHGRCLSRDFRFCASFGDTETLGSSRGRELPRNLALNRKVSCAKGRH